MMGRTRGPYPAEYRAELVRLVREEGRSIASLAREFEPSVQSITNWVAQAEIEGRSLKGWTTASAAKPTWAAPA